MEYNKHRLTKLIKLLVIVVGILVLGSVLLSMSPRGAVRLRIFYDWHPITAMMCSPYHDKDFSRYVNATVYSISSKEQYFSKDGSFKVDAYRIHQHAFFYTAIEQPDIVK